MKSRHPEKENKPVNPIKKKPEWIRSKLTNSKEFFLTKTIVNNNNLVTVCQEANCPNITECWSKRHSTFMIMGDTCTRACAFCDVKTGVPGKLDQLEPVKIAEAVKKLNLKHVVITSVDRDDLDDGGSEHFFEVINQTRKSTSAALRSSITCNISSLFSPKPTIIPDFVKTFLFIFFAFFKSSKEAKYLDPGLTFKYKLGTVSIL